MGFNSAPKSSDSKNEELRQKFETDKTPAQVEEAAHIENIFRTLVTEARERGEMAIPDDEIGNISKVYTRGILFGKDTVVEGVDGTKNVFGVANFHKPLRSFGSFGGEAGRDDGSGLKRKELDAINQKYNPVFLRMLYDEAVSQARAKTIHI